MTWDKNGYNEMYNIFRSRYYANKYAKQYLNKDEYIIQKWGIVDEQCAYYIHRLSDLEIRGIKQK